MRRSARSINVCERTDGLWGLPPELMCRVQRGKTWYSGSVGVYCRRTRVKMEILAETYDQFVEFWRRLVAAHGLQPVEFHPKKGQALIWAANLLHGGMPQRDKNKTRWSQVTHYFFEDCAYYTPLGSLPYLGSVEYRELTDVATGAPVRQAINGMPLTGEIVRHMRRKRFDVDGGFASSNAESATPRPGFLRTLRERLRGG